MIRLPLIAPLLATTIFAFIPMPTLAANAPVRAEQIAEVLSRPSANSFDATVTKLTADVAAKGIRHFATIDQGGLARGASLPLHRSTLILFGNPPLGVQFLQSNPLAGLDWPVRMLVTEDAAGKVTVSWTDFGAIARRYGIADRDAQFKMASEVAASIATAATQ